MAHQAAGLRFTEGQVRTTLTLPSSMVIAASHRHREVAVCLTSSLCVLAQKTSLPCPHRLSRRHSAETINKCGLVCAGDVPLWVDPEDRHDPEQKRISRNETFVPAPHWLFDIYPFEGMKGFWGKSQPRVVGGHLIELGGHHQQSKRFVLKMFHWSVSSCTPHTSWHAWCTWWVRLFAVLMGAIETQQTCMSANRHVLYFTNVQVGLRSQQNCQRQQDMGRRN
jgi:hypothetical protein